MTGSDRLPSSTTRPGCAVDVHAVLSARKNGATDADVRRVTKTLARLEAAAADAQTHAHAAGGAPEALSQALRALADD